MHTKIEEEPVGLGGRMVVVAGAKGGVGTTTLAAQLALEGASAAKNRPVCLVDLDLQTGDVGVLLDVAHRRSIADLIEVVDDISARHLDETLYRHQSGLRVLLAPPEGELAEDVTGAIARQVLGAIKFRHEVVVVDVGCRVSEATAAAVEMADDVVVIVTPDVPAMRAANRLISMWERLQIRKDGMRCVVNRVSKDLEIQPELVRRVVDVPTVPSTIPASFRALEQALNTGAPARLQDGLFKRAMANLALELEVAG
jgi:pilus assembly protein CpaE